MDGLSDREYARHRKPPNSEPFVLPLYINQHGNDQLTMDLYLTDILELIA